ncbi:MAG: iron donor protein CyaY [Neisseriaceae bacterium]
MNDAEFLNEAERAFLEIIEELENYDWDFDYDHQGDILTIYNDTEECVVITHNLGRHELWVVIGKESYHFIHRGKNWVWKKDNGLVLLAAVKDHLDEICGNRGQLS